MLEAHMNDRNSDARTSDNEYVSLPEAGPEMTLELSERDWDALMEAIANPSLPNAAMLQAIEDWRQHMHGESNDEDPALEVPG
jgi:hypothetical protein